MKKHRDYDIYIGNRMELSVVYEGDMELFFVIDGNITILAEEKEIVLPQKGIYIKNIGIERSIRFRKDAVLCAIRFSRQFLMDLNGHTCPFFLLTDEEPAAHQELLENLQELCYVHFLSAKKTDARKCSILYNILDILMEHFQMENHGESGRFEDEKVERIISFVYNNFQDHISLDELAEELFASKSTLSRAFKKHMGIYFADYVNEVRLKNAVSQLVYTDKNITRIALDSGFSNASTLNRIFKETYGESPREYREKKWKEIRKEYEIAKAEEEQIREKVADVIQVTGKHSNQQVEVLADLNDTQPFQGFWNQTINMGSVYDMTLSNLQFHTLFLAENLGFSHIRLWNIFSKKLRLTDGTNMGNYNYDALDSAFDFLVNNHLKVWLDFGKRPNTAIRTPGEAIFFEEDYVDFPSEKNWETAVVDVLRHLQRRYGKEELNGWIFELSMDPFHENAFYYDTDDVNYRKAFFFFYEAVKHYAPRALAGGPSGVQERLSIEGFHSFLKECKQKNVIPDFFSLLYFPYMEVAEQGKRRIKKPETTELLRLIKGIRSLQEEEGMEKCQIFISEFNSSLSNRNYLNDSCYRGNYFIKMVQELSGYVDMLCCWFGSDWLSSYFDTRSIANGAGGLLTKDTIKKPVYHALAFLNQLGSELLASGEGYLVTKNAPKSYTILCFHSMNLPAQYYLENEKELDVTQLERLFPDEAREFTFTLKGVPESSEQGNGYVVKRSRINRKRGGILAEWGRFGYESELKREDIKYIRDVSIPYQERQHVQAVDGVLSITLIVPDQEMVLVQIMEEE